MVILKNGTRVANFSSSHSFTFTDGTILPSALNEVSEQLEVTFIEDIDEDGDVSLSFSLNHVVLDVVATYQWLFDNDAIDKVLIPLPMMTALKKMEWFSVKDTPFRCVRMEDRINKLVSTEKWCI